VVRGSTALGPCGVSPSPRQRPPTRDTAAGRVGALRPTAAPSCDSIIERVGPPGGIILMRKDGLDRFSISWRKEEIRDRRIDD
jgi:hypothetical protein